jgi:hypothetical protein
MLKVFFWGPACEKSTLLIVKYLFLQHPSRNCLAYAFTTRILLSQVSQTGNPQKNDFITRYSASPLSRNSLSKYELNSMDINIKLQVRMVCGESSSSSLPHNNNRPSREGVGKKKSSHGGTEDTEPNIKL